MYKKIGMTGFEPAAPSSRTKCATKLRHIPAQLFQYTKNIIKSDEWESGLHIHPPIDEACYHLLCTNEVVEADCDC